MDDATNASVKNLLGVHPDGDLQTAESRGAGAPQGDSATPDFARKDATPTDQKALDRWFLEQRGGQRVPKRLEVPNEALVTSGGPLKITGNLTLISEDGHVMHANHLTLCRCGASQSKPLCDEQHLEVEFLDTGGIEQASDCMPVNRPQTLIMTCIQDGPLKYRGYLRVYNRKGQECLSMQGALCRCGKSTKKPFCDCQ